MLIFIRLSPRWSNTPLISRDRWLSPIADESSFEWGSKPDGDGSIETENGNALELIKLFATLFSPVVNEPRSEDVELMHRKPAGLIEWMSLSLGCRWCFVSHLLSLSASRGNWDEMRCSTIISHIRQSSESINMSSLHLVFDLSSNCPQMIFDPSGLLIKHIWSNDLATSIRENKRQICKYWWIRMNDMEICVFACWPTLREASARGGVVCLSVLEGQSRNNGSRLSSYLLTRLRKPTFFLVKDHHLTDMRTILCTVSSRQTKRVSISISTRHRFLVRNVDDVCISSTLCSLSLVTLMETSSSSIIKYNSSHLFYLIDDSGRLFSSHDERAREWLAFIIELAIRLRERERNFFSPFFFRWLLTIIDPVFLSISHERTANPTLFNDQHVFISFVNEPRRRRKKGEVISTASFHRSVYLSLSSRRASLKWGISLHSFSRRSGNHGNDVDWFRLFLSGNLFACSYSGRYADESSVFLYLQTSDPQSFKCDHRGLLLLSSDWTARSLHLESELRRPRTHSQTSSIAVNQKPRATFAVRL